MEPTKQSKGGLARKEKTSPEKRSEIAKNASILYLAYPIGMFLALGSAANF